MKGDQLNSRRWDILNTLEKQLEEALNSLRNAKYYERFTSYEEYRNDYYSEFVMKGLNAELALAKVVEFINE